MSLENCGVFQLLKEVILCMLCHSLESFVCGNFARHSSAFSGFGGICVQPVVLLISE